MSSSRELLAEINDEMLFADGYVSRFGQPPIALYDRARGIRTLIAEGCSHEEAVEHFEFNVIGGWHGENTPAFVTLLSELE